MKGEFGRKTADKQREYTRIVQNIASNDMENGKCPPNT